MPVFKVLYRNTNRIQEKGGRKEEVLRRVKPAGLAEGRPGGEAVRIPVSEVHRVGRASEGFRKTVALFDLSLLAQSQQSTACQALHQVESRAARWLLQCRKRLGSNDISLTQEFFGQMLGVQRTTINMVERTLQNAGLVQIGRGRISILDLEGLHSVACDCYERIERRYEELLGPLDES